MSPVKGADPEKPYILQTDASGYTLGAALVQREKCGNELVNTLSEHNYSVAEREALAVVWPVNKYRTYIEGASVTVVTDHPPLKYLMTPNTPLSVLPAGHFYYSH